MNTDSMLNLHLQAAFQALAVLRAEEDLMGQGIPELILSWKVLDEVVQNSRMFDWNRVFVYLQILLGDVGFIAARFVLGEQMVERLVLGRADFRRNGFVPLIRVGVLRIDIINHPAKAEEAMRDDLTDIELSLEFHHPHE